MQDQGPNTEHLVCQFFGGSGDFEVNFLALKEETDGIFLSYTVVQCTSSVCDALAKSRNEFESQSCSASGPP